MDCWAPTANGAAAEPAPTDPESTTGPVATKARRKSVTIVADPESYDGGDEEAPAPRITTQRAFLHPSLRHVKFKKDFGFDMDQLPKDLVRVYFNLRRDVGEEYAKQMVFLVRTAVELHRAWHLTLLTSKVLQQIKDKFGLRVAWNLGVLKLRFFIEDGDYDLSRKVPYDYDSEYQDKYMRIACALVQGHVDVDQALQYQIETKEGKHTAPSGMWLRDFPGRLVLYPLQASTCAVIFFGGDGPDAAIAALTGLTAGLLEWGLGLAGELGKPIVDVLVGTSTGVIGGLFYRHYGESHCLSAIFLGTLYWFFYGTAFTIGLLEIIAGELETGVTRFMAVAVKTFVLCLGAGFGMMLTGAKTSEMWLQQADSCGTIDLDDVWWRIPLYLLCSASALGQYRFPIVDYWRGLIVQLVAYEVQYQLLLFFEQRHDRDNMDYASSNAAGAAAAVVAACALAYAVDLVRDHYYQRILQVSGRGPRPLRHKASYCLMKACVGAGECLKLGRTTEPVKMRLKKKLAHNIAHVESDTNDDTEFSLEDDEHNVLLETIVSAENLNIWAILMPAIYQLVPGSMIAKLWFNSIFPPPLDYQVYPVETVVNGTATLTYYTSNLGEAQDNVYSNLMVISASLALGTILGFVFVRVSWKVLYFVLPCSSGWCQSDTAKLEQTLGGDSLSSEERRDLVLRQQSREDDRDLFDGMFTAAHTRSDQQ